MMLNKKCLPLYLILLLFQLVAIFDVQRLLLQRVRSKTYGERFYEMGIR
jgi:hypothetical protein